MPLMRLSRKPFATACEASLPDGKASEPAVTVMVGLPPYSKLACSDADLSQRTDDVGTRLRGRIEGRRYKYWIRQPDKLAAVGADGEMDQLATDGKSVRPWRTRPDA